MSLDEVILGVLIFAAALLYSSVGHGGASGYLAAMALVGLAPEVMRPTALSLNILVALIGTARYVGVGAFSWRLFWPLAALSIPFAFLGGYLELAGEVYKPLVGLVLLYAAWKSFRTARRATEDARERPQLAVLLALGAGIGFLSGLTGVGGGIFLSPLLLFFRWANVRMIAGIAAAFILVNSIAGLLGVVTSSPSLPAGLPLWAAAAVLGGLLGSEFGSRRLGNPAIQRLLAAVLLIAGVKMIAMV